MANTAITVKIDTGEALSKILDVAAAAFWYVECHSVFVWASYELNSADGLIEIEASLNKALLGLVASVEGVKHAVEG